MKSSSCRLSVNVNKIATLRNSRGGDVPNLRQYTNDIIRYGAQGITVHPRPDERHIRRDDVYTLNQLIKKINSSRKKKIEFNIEGYPSKSFLKLVATIRPDQVTLVPDPPDVLTSNAGWQVAKNEKLLARVLKFFRQKKIRSSLFIDVLTINSLDLAALSRLQPDRVELYTERFAKDYVTKSRHKTTMIYKKTSQKIYALGIDINAGHDLNLQNIRFLLQSIPEIKECSIGHALIAESLYLGLKATIKNYLSQMRRMRHAKLDQ
ncbi:MAG: pyridoxine 5'-phosphate synthase [Bdellovibrionales bacterium RBG_16_40_8]|nr:MAG: pyridoxine 5'-phosphate synthase [Bdellovibrionales bacterium RBG_16_40_8]